MYGELYSIEHSIEKPAHHVELLQDDQKQVGSFEKVLQNLKKF